MKKTVVVSLSFLIMLGHASWSQANSSYVGIVRSVSNEASVLRNHTPIPAETNMKVMNGDVLKTGPDGSLGLIFEDDTIVSMGPASEFIIQDFAFSPAEKKLSLLIKMIQGTFAFLSGQLTKLAPDSVHLETPDATIGMRGTHVLIQIDGR